MNELKFEEKKKKENVQYLKFWCEFNLDRYQDVSPRELDSFERGMLSVFRDVLAILEKGEDGLYQESEVEE